MKNYHNIKNILKRLQKNSAGIYFFVYGSSVIVALIKTLCIAGALIPEQMGWFITISLLSAVMIYLSNLGVMDAYLIRTRIIQRRAVPAAVLRGQLYMVVTFVSATATTIILGYANFYYSLENHAILWLALLKYPPNRVTFLVAKYY